MTRPIIDSICPFFIVSHIETIIAFYQDKLGFETWYKEPEENPYFAIVRRDGAWLLLKAGEAEPLPNPKRDPAMRWDAFCNTLDPDGLAAGVDPPTTAANRFF
jgi:catechol 2,3-dioxygenase-like lactoylglutathione lyase family enzyme